MAELVDATDLKSVGSQPSRFESGRGHQVPVTKDRWKVLRYARVDTNYEPGSSMKRSIVLCLLGLMAGTAGAEQWFMVQAPVSVSVDAASIEILPLGLRRARVKLDMSLAPPARNEPAKRLLFDISVMVFDCGKRASRMESGENHLADGTVTKWERSNPEDIWLRTDTDAALAYVCAWPGPDK